MSANPYSWLLLPVLKPVSRTLAGLIAIPASQLFRRRVVRIQELDEELEKDIDEWIRGALLLLLATANVEAWMHAQFSEKWNVNWFDQWWVTAGRLLLAIGVIEAMPDQQLFAIIHPGPPLPRYLKDQGLWGSIREQFKPIAKGIICQYLNRSSPVYVIMAAIFGGYVATLTEEQMAALSEDELAQMAAITKGQIIGWVCYFLAISQYLIIGLVTSRDRAIDVLTEFDRKMAQRRQELIEEFDIDETKTSAPLTLTPAWMAATYSARSERESKNSHSD